MERERGGEETGLRCGARGKSENGQPTAEQPRMYRNF